MNPVFWILLILGLVLFWMLCAFLFKPLGKLGHGVWKDVEEAMEDKEQVQEDSNKSEKE